MKTIGIKGVFKKDEKLFTLNPESCKGITIYNEKLINIGDKQYRSWNPYRSKLAAALYKGLKFEIKTDSNILYLGAATGTTVSHISDIIQNGVVYAVENSPIAMNELLQLCKQRQNIIPILEDAFHPERYQHFVPPIDLIYQDISQRNQADIFIANIDRYLKKKHNGILMVKARSIDISLQPKKAYQQVCSQLTKHKLKIHDTIELTPYEKDHAAIIASN